MFGPDYAAGCPTNSSIADSFNGVLPHLEARDVTMICISGAPLEKLLAYREQMGWSFTWASSYQSDFSFDFGISGTEEATRAWVAPLLEDGLLPPIASQNASACGTDVVRYLAEGFGVNVFVRESDTVYHTYASTSRGVEFLMGYYPVLDRTPKGRDESDGFQLWLRRQDEYESQRPSSELPGDFNAKLIDEFRANQGRVTGVFEGTPLLVLHHTGAKSGKDRITPLGYLDDDGRYVVIASNGGAPTSPHWYHNLKATPNVTIEVGTKTIDVVASEATGEERKRLYRTQAERFPQLTDYEQETDRVIPVIILTPSDND